MSYGSTAFAAASMGGLIASAGTFFSPSESLPRGSRFRTLEYTGNAEWFQVVLQMENVPTEPLRTVRVYSNNDPGENPQLQVTMGEANYSQGIIGAARFITVELEMLDPWPETPTGPIDITITGNEYFQ